MMIMALKAIAIITTGCIAFALCCAMILLGVMSLRLIFTPEEKKEPQE